jgi:hypothetical protein
VGTGVTSFFPGRTRLKDLRVEDGYVPRLGLALASIAGLIYLIPMANRIAFRASSPLAPELGSPDTLVPVLFGATAIALTSIMVTGVAYLFTRGRIAAKFVAATLYFGLLIVPFLVGFNAGLRNDAFTARFAAFGVVLIVLLELFVDANNVSLHSSLQLRLWKGFFLEDRGKVDGSGETIFPREPMAAIGELRLRSDLDPLKVSFTVATSKEAKVGGKPLLSCTIHRVNPTDPVKAVLAATALSGAAFNPVVGRSSTSSFRSMMCLLNLRLGLWYEGDQEAQIGLPKAMLFEMFPMLFLRGRYNYRSDGGVFDNLGLMPLLTSDYTDVLCFDASFRTEVDSPALYNTFRNARKMFGVEIDEVQGASDEIVRQFVVRRPDFEPMRLTVVTCQVWQGAPFELKYRGRTDRWFPMVPTNLQLADKASFDELVTLGHAAAEHAVARIFEPSD